MSVVVVTTCDTVLFLFFRRAFKWQKLLSTFTINEKTFATSQTHIHTQIQAYPAYKYIYPFTKCANHACVTTLCAQIFAQMRNEAITINILRCRQQPAANQTVCHRSRRWCCYCCHCGAQAHMPLRNVFSRVHHRTEPPSWQKQTIMYIKHTTLRYFRATNELLGYGSSFLPDA